VKRGVLRHAGDTSVLVFAEEHSVRRPANNFAKKKKKKFQLNCQVSNYAGRCMVINHTTSHVYRKTVLEITLFSSVDFHNGNFRTRKLHLKEPHLRKRWKSDPCSYDDICDWKWPQEPDLQLLMATGPYV
jgi:hypothetical protein